MVTSALPAKRAGDLQFRRFAKPVEWLVEGDFQRIGVSVELAAT